MARLLACLSLQCWHAGPHSGLRCAEPDVLGADAVPALKWGPPDEQGLVDFLVGEKNFNEDRVRKQVQKMAATKGKSNQGGRV